MKTVLPGELSAFISYRNKADSLNEVTAEELDIIRFRKGGALHKEIAHLTGKSVSAIEKKFTKLCQQFNVANTHELLRLFYCWPVYQGSASSIKST